MLVYTWDVYMSCSNHECEYYDLGFRAWVRNLGFYVLGLGFRIQRSGFRIYGLGLMIQH